MVPSLIVGTRGSPLALAQVSALARALAAVDPALAPAGAIRPLVIRTTGDRIQDRTLAALGGKGLFTKEIDEALLSGAADLAVHSMKDVPTSLPDNIEIGAVLPREDPRDALIAPGAPGLDALRPGAVVGTASLRRQALLRAARPDLDIRPLRGNVGTRLERLAEGVVEATVLAMAGLNRLARPDVPCRPLEPAEMLPAIAQGAIGIACRRDDERMRALLARIDCPATHACVRAERGFLAALDGSCRTPIAGLAQLSPDSARVRFSGLIVTPDGRRLERAVIDGPAEEASALGLAAGEGLRRRLGADFALFMTPSPLPESVP